MFRTKKALKARIHQLNEMISKGNESFMILRRSLTEEKASTRALAAKVRDLETAYASTKDRMENYLNICCVDINEAFDLMRGMIADEQSKNRLYCNAFKGREESYSKMAGISYDERVQLRHELKEANDRREMAEEEIRRLKANMKL
jgi:uncharacterized protein YlxW (UPF0749 family)